jgi:glutamyl-tRNA synthetase
MSRILSMNEHYIKTIDESELCDHLVQYCQLFKEKIKSDKEEKIKASLMFLKNKAKTLEDIYNNSKYIIFDEVNFNKEDLKLLDKKAKKIILEFMNMVKDLKVLNKETLEVIINNLIKFHETNFKGVGQPLRVALTGSKFGPGVYDIIISLGKEEVIKRLGNKILG